MTFRLLYAHPVRKDLDSIPEVTRRRILSAIAQLSEDPRPRGCKKLVGHDLWRIRIGRYRAVYSIDDAQAVVRIEYVRHRKDAYRG
jgi:mRNA interferase RelE/StbE